MKLTFYGTGASEGVPAVFCECESCVQARKLGGRNLRTRTSARVDDHVLIDFSVDSFAHVLFGGLRQSHLDCVVLDCTSVMTPDVFSSHMSFQDNVAIRRRMLQEKIADEKTIFIATHFAHTYILPHSELQQRMAPEGFIPAYDGLCVEF